MVDRAAIKASLDEWTAWYRKAAQNLTKREGAVKLHQNLGTALTGVRRCGKTYCALELGRHTELETLYFNFEDPIFLKDNSVKNLDILISVYTEYVGREPQLLIFDEIQNIDGWERWARRCIDTQRWQLIITGSSAKLLSSDISTSIAGRCLEQQIWPLSFLEYLRFTNTTCTSNLEYIGAMRSFLKWGGFPAVALEPDEMTRTLILRQYLGDIVHKDVLGRNEIRNKRHLDQIVLFAMTNPASLFSYTSLKRAYGMNTDTAQAYIDALQDAFLVFEVPRFHPNLKVQSRDAKKIYVIDTGMRNAHARSVNDDLGKLAENATYIELRRRGLDVFYFKDVGEVDFLITTAGKPATAIQVCYSDMEDPATKGRELSSLLNCLEETGLKAGTILTLDRKETLRLEGRTIHMIPLYEFLLNDPAKQTV